jgi:hypothetical protein
LVSKIERIENELQNLDSYKRDKELHDTKFAQLQAELMSEQHNNVLMLEEQERSGENTISSPFPPSLYLFFPFFILIPSPPSPTGNFWKVKLRS